MSGWDADKCPLIKLVGEPADGAMLLKPFTSTEDNEVGSLIVAVG